MNIINNKKILISGLIIGILITVAFGIWYYYRGVILMDLLERKLKRNKSLEFLIYTPIFKQLKDGVAQERIYQ